MDVTEKRTPLRANRVYDMDHLELHMECQVNFSSHTTTTLTSVENKTVFNWMFNII